MASRTIVCVSLAVLVFFVSYGWSLNCYSCQHDGVFTNNSDCLDEFKAKDNLKVNCSLIPGNFTCAKVTGKLTFNSKSTDAVFRACVEKSKDCKAIKEGLEQGATAANANISFSHCSTCEKDLCNGVVA